MKRIDLETVSKKQSYSEGSVIFSLIFCFLCQGQGFAANGRKSARPGMPPGGPMGRDPRFRQGSADSGTGEAMAAVEDILNVFLQTANQTAMVTASEIEEAKEVFKQSRRFKPKFTDNQKCRYRMLGSWLNFYLGDIETALNQARLAYKADSSDEDGKSTYAVMAFLNRSYNEIKLLSRGGAKTTSTRNRGRMYSPPASQGYSTKILDFEVSSIRVEILEQQIPRIQGRCLNGSIFDYDSARDGVLCGLIWKVESQEPADSRTFRNTRRNTRTTRTTPTGPMMPGGLPPMPGANRNMMGMSTGVDSQIESFNQMFINGIDSGGIIFVGINLNDISEKRLVLEKLADTAMPWAQTIASEPINQGLERFVSLDADEPLLLIVGPDGVVRYAGQVGGFMPDLILSTLVVQNPAAGQGVFTVPAKQPSRKTAFSFPAFPKPQPAEQAEEESEELTPEAIDAQRLYEGAVLHSEVGKKPMLGYRHMVDACRMIFERYPDSPEAEKARELIRNMPERYRKRYRITPEELGEEKLAE